MSETRTTTTFSVHASTEEGACWNILDITSDMGERGTERHFGWDWNQSLEDATATGDDANLEVILTIMRAKGWKITKSEIMSVEY
jgi:hypothetical protein